MKNKLSKNGRRKFIATSLKGGLVLGLGMNSTSTFLQSCAPAKSNGLTPYRTGFDQQPLPYKFDALENIIDALTMEIHYTKHAAAYSKNLKEAAMAESIVTGKTVEDILSKVSAYSSKLRNNAGGHYNHEMFWQCMRPSIAGNLPSEQAGLTLAINKTFGSIEVFKKQFADAGKSRFGSGWAWLYADKDKNLKIGSTPNQDNPLMDLSEIKGFPILALDVWEHAYYLKYQNKRADYIDNWWSVVNWDYVQQRFEKISS